MATWKLQKDPPVKSYVEFERELFSLLPPNGMRVTNPTLVNLRKKAGGWKPKYPRGVVHAAMNKLIEKVTLNKEPFEIHRTETGRRCDPVAYWIQAAGTSKQAVPKPKRKSPFRFRSKPTSRRSLAGVTRASLLS